MLITYTWFVSVNGPGYNSYVHYTRSSVHCFCLRVSTYGRIFLYSDQANPYKKSKLYVTVNTSSINVHILRQPVFHHYKTYFWYQANESSSIYHRYQNNTKVRRQKSSSLCDVC